jgi:hypothetical protein
MVDLKDHQESLERLVSWQNVTNLEFLRLGRTALYKLDSPIPILNSDKLIRSLKIKGIGAKISRDIPLLQPTSFSVQNPNPHFGITDGGEFVPIYSDPAPIGGITISRAKKEFEIAEHLFQYDCPSVIPLQVYQYNDLSFFSEKNQSSEPLGVVITGLLDEHDLRADSVFDYPNLSPDKQKVIHRWAEMLNVPRGENMRIALIAAISKLFGKTIRKFSESDLYRYSGAPDNYSYSEITGEVFLIDLDSVSILSDLSDNEKPLQVVRDAASGIAYLLAFLTNPKWVNDFSEKSVIQFNPFRELLIGYYSEVDQRYIHDLSEVIIKYYQDVRKQALTYFDSVSEITNVRTVDEFGEYLSNSYKRPWISRGDTFSYLIPLCWLLHQQSKLKYKWSSSISIENLFERIGKLSDPTVNSKEFISSKTASSVIAALRPFLSTSA